MYRLPAAAAITLLDAGWHGRAAAVSLPSSSLRRRSPNNAKASSPRSNTGSPTPASKRSTPDPPDHQARLRLPLAPSPDRARDAQPRRPLPFTPRPVTPPTETSGLLFWRARRRGRRPVRRIRVARVRDVLADRLGADPVSLGELPDPGSAFRRRGRRPTLGRGCTARSRRARFARAAPRPSGHGHRREGP
jgi:hypothetical protein